MYDLPHFVSSTLTGIPQSFGYLNPLVNFYLAYTIIVILNCHSSVNFTYFYFMLPQKPNSVNGVVILDVSQYY
jgi:hypothetical protein